eukprot:1628907-Amphidinium_carterae.1
MELCEGWKPIVSIEREAKTLARLRHPGILNFLGAFEVDTESNRGVQRHGARTVRSDSMRAMSVQKPSIVAWRWSMLT